MDHDLCSVKLFRLLHGVQEIVCEVILLIKRERFFPDFVQKIRELLSVWIDVATFDNVFKHQRNSLTQTVTHKTILDVE